MNRKELKIRNLTELGLILLIIVLLGYLSSLISIRLDLTSEKRYSLSPATKEILRKLEHELYIQVYLDGDMPIGFKKMRTSITDMLEEFRVYSRKKMDFEFIDPSENQDPEVRNEIFMELAGKGLKPTNVQVTEKDGGTSQKILFPGLILNYNTMEMAVNLLKNNPALPAEQNLNNSVESLEYELISSIKNVSADTIFKVAFIEGHGELDEYQVADITMELARYYNIDRGVIGGKTGILDEYAAIVVAKPREPISEADKFVIDQYIMNGGKVLWLVEEVSVNWDSLVYTTSTVGMYSPLNIEDQLFKYGVRINPILIKDINCTLIPVNIALAGEQPEFAPVPWLYFPLMIPPENLPITRNINMIKGEFVNVLDTVGGSGRISKTFLLTSSKYSGTVNPPCLITLEEVRKTPEEGTLNQSFLPVAALLEGEFESIFKNRLVSDFLPSKEYEFRETSLPNRMIVIADGDIIRNEVSVRGDRIIPLPLDQDRYTNQSYGNKDFIVNCINYMLDQSDLMPLRSRELKLRLLDKSKINEYRIGLQMINTIFPVAIIIISGLVIRLLRKKKFEK
ncbi:MAG: gliding motility-associated ABC transporter substrate-binding protein GldG [Bacteroidales bacterium]|nr:MAG: gliding motility-associated ABC transporter substrate-binding protein GldG [Bacteroidales bacterium]